MRIDPPMRIQLPVDEDGDGTCDGKDNCPCCKSRPGGYGR